MAGTIVLDPIDDELVIPAPDVSHLVTEDDTPVDNLFSERQMALLRETLYTSWDGPGAGRTFVAMAKIAVYATNFTPPLVPDLLLSLDVTPPDEPMLKEHRSYFLWLYGKPPEVVVEIVSNRKGGELSNKLLDYARLGVAYYIVYDNEGEISEEPLRIFTRQGARYIESTERWLAEVELGVTIWRGVYNGMVGDWLRWVDKSGVLLSTGSEAKAQERQRAEQERQRAEQERQRAEQERQRAGQERRRADALAAKLQELGIDPAEIVSKP
ncbi:MAG TPA: Uma2 family endonuclease [Caldilineaceae bacterium]|nr:Uma2 family endonuclease [Caldilineaceae bacterium]